MSDNEIVENIAKTLHERFPDFKGLYFFGSRITGNSHPESDYDIVIIFDELNYEKRLEIAGVIGELDYKYNIIIDYKELSVSGKRSIEYIRQNVNPIFVEHAIDNGRFYAGG